MNETTNIISYSDQIQIIRIKEATIILSHRADIVYLNMNSFLYFSRNNNYSIRIEEIFCTDKRCFKRLLDILLDFAIHNNFKEIYYADKIAEEYLNRFINWGFVEKKVVGYDTNHFLHYYITDKHTLRKGYNTFRDYLKNVLKGGCKTCHRNQ
ncbi:hypothetical protein SAMN06297422_10725 [Lachnospiraceae bacterium]|nr:hypothetical protein SAMN06297422_10725 [Lachnospiraceae bacterium]